MSAGAIGVVTIDPSDNSTGCSPKAGVSRPRCRRFTTAWYETEWISLFRSSFIVRRRGVMTIKEKIGKKRKATRPKSSFSGRTAASRPVKDVLELGKHLVAELELEESRDTLAKWLAHHLAELIAD